MSDYLTWLASLDESGLATLLGNRPEVLRGTPARDLAALESRLSQHQAVATALLRQPRPAVQVLTALLLSGGRVSVDRCAGVLQTSPGTGDHVEQVRGWLRRLAAYGLAWVDTDQVAHVLPSVAAVLSLAEEAGTPAATLVDQISKDRLSPVLRAWGLPAQTTKAATAAVLAEAFADPVRVAAQLERLTAEQRATLADGTGASFEGHRHQWLDRRMSAIQAGAAAGVVLGGYSAYEGHVPAEVRIALRDKPLPFDPVEPTLPIAEASPEMVERESRAALVQFSEACLTILDHVRDRPVAWVRTGGIGAREVSRVAKACKVEVPVVRLVLECAYAAGLLEWDGPVLRCGEVAGAWRDLDPGARVTLLLERWPVIPWSPTQTHDAAGKALAVGDMDRDCPRCVDGRMTTLAEWLRVPPGRGVDDAALATLVSWIRPLAHTAHREIVEEPDPWGYGYGRGRRGGGGGGGTPRAVPDPFIVPDDEPTLGTVADEARLLGLVAHGAAAPLLHALLAGDRARVVALADEMLPAAAGQAAFGSDLTAVVTGPPTGDLSSLLDSCADRESRGGAVTWRFTTTSVRRALDAGVTAAELASRLESVATTGLPQPLTYLLGDVGRRHGSLRVAPARAVIRCEDEGLLAEVASDRKLRKVRLRLVAPTVAVSSVGEAETIEALRAAGYLPMPWAGADDAGGDGEARGSAAAGGSGGGGTAGGNAARTGRAEGAGSGVIDLASRRMARGQASAGNVGPDNATDKELERVLAELSATVERGRQDPSPTLAPEPESAEAAAARLVGTLRAARGTDADPKLVAALRGVNRVLSDDEVRILASAIVEGGAVLIRYRSASGSITDRVISDMVYSGNLLEAWCHLRDDTRNFLASEVLSVDYP
jgi:Helicase conserved C-terminal domain